MLDHEPEAVTWARKKADLTKRALARTIGVSEQLIGEIESGWRNATPANLRKIADALNCPLVVLECKRPTFETPRAVPTLHALAVTRRPMTHRNECSLDMTTTPMPERARTPQDVNVDDVDVDVAGGTALLRGVGQIIAALRRQAGLTQGELGQRISYGEEMVSKVERGIRIPRPEFIDSVRPVLNDTAGVLAAVRDELARARYCDILGKLQQEEAQAVGIHAYDIHVLNPLLQTEDYMCALLTMQTPPLSAAAIQHRVTARLCRQQVLHRDPPPVTSFVIDEALLRRPYGGPDVLSAQLEHLVSLAQLPHVDLQVMPLDQEHHAGTAGPFTLMDTRKHTRNAYVEVQGMRIHTEHDRVRDLEAAYGRIRAQALSPRNTLDLIEKLLAGAG